MFNDGVSAEKFYHLKLSEDDQINLIYYIIESRMSKQSKGLNVWAIALASHHDINELSVRYLLSLRSSYLNKKIYQNISVSSKIKEKIFKTTATLRCEFALKTTNLEMINKFLKDSSVKVRRSLLYNPFLYNQDSILEQMMTDLDPEVSKQSKELLDIAELDVRKLCMTRESFQFENID